MDFEAERVIGFKNEHVGKEGCHFLPIQLLIFVEERG